jgi:hypothetical protein
MTHYATNISIDTEKAREFANNCNWNLSIFDVHDELRGEPRHIQMLYLLACIEFMIAEDSRVQLVDLLRHLCDADEVDCRRELKLLGYDLSLLNRTRQ